MGNDIPLSKLEEGFHKGFAHVQKMIDSSIILHESGHHSTSIAISILAHEELAKLRYVVAHIGDQKPISLKEWKALSRGGSHNAKLEKFYADFYNDIIRLCSERPETVLEANPNLTMDEVRDFPKRVDLKHLTVLGCKLNDIKKECIYLDWNDGDWSTFDNNTTKDERTALASFLHVLVLRTVFVIKPEYDNLEAPLAERVAKVNMSEYAALRNKLEGIQDEITSKSLDKTIQTVMSFIGRYSKL